MQPMWCLMPKENSEDLVGWERFEYVEVPSKSNVTRKKLLFVKQKTSSTEMFSYLCQLLETFASHQFRAVWQNRQLKQNISLLPQNDVVCIHDFSEKLQVFNCEITFCKINEYVYSSTLYTP